MGRTLVLVGDSVTDAGREPHRRPRPGERVGRDGGRRAERPYGDQSGHLRQPCARPGGAGDTDVLALEHRCELVPTDAIMNAAATTVLPGALAADGVHPREQGHRLLTDTLLSTYRCEPR